MSELPCTVHDSSVPIPSHVKLASVLSEVVTDEGATVITAVNEHMSIHWHNTYTLLVELNLHTSFVYRTR